VGDARGEGLAAGAPALPLPPPQVLCIREELLEHGDFSYSVKALQHYESRVPLHTLLERAHALYAADHPQLYAPPAAPPPRPPPPPDRMSSNGAAYL